MYENIFQKAFMLSVIYLFQAAAKDKNMIVVFVIPSKNNSV